MKGLEIAERIQHVESMGKIYNNLSGLEIELGNMVRQRNLL